MTRFLVAGMWISRLRVLDGSRARRWLGRSQSRQCLFSGPIGTITGNAIGDPLRYEVDADGRALLIIHKVQTNHDFNDPFKPKILAEKPTCRLKLDCLISKQGLKDIGVQSTRQEQGGS